MTPHGALSTYTNWGCRCDLCRKANRDYMKQYVAIRRNLEPPADAHGTISTYKNWRCRCAQCAEANTNWQREYRRRKANR